MQVLFCNGLWHYLLSSEFHLLEFHHKYSSHVFKLINIFEFMFLELYLDYSQYIFIGLMSWEWGKPVLILISQLLYHFKVSTDTSLLSLFIYRTNLFSKISLIFGRISETHSIFFWVHVAWKENQWEFWLTWNCTVFTYSLVSRFSLFFMKLPLGNTHL